MRHSIDALSVLSISIVILIVAGCAQTPVPSVKQTGSGAADAMAERGRRLAVRTKGKPKPRPVQSAATEATGRRSDALGPPADLNTPVPVVGSAEWRREQEYFAARERDIQRLIRGICVGCLGPEPRLYSATDMPRRGRFTVKGPGDLPVERASAQPRGPEPFAAATAVTGTVPTTKPSSP